MKVYVDELPVDDCPCNYDGMCNLLGYKNECNICYYEGKRRKDCPLQPLTDYTKQVRKEVREEFKEIVRQKYPICYMNFGEQLFNLSDMTISLKKVTEILDQIQGGDNA